MWNRDDMKQVQNIEKALNGEYSAIICYEKLAAMAPNAKDKKRILEIRDDEIRHYQIFSVIYNQLTGKNYTPTQTESCAHNFHDGIKTAFYDEQETVDFYLKVSDEATNSYIKDIFRRIAMDEQNHAVWFLYMVK